VPALSAALKDQDAMGRRYAANALAQIGKEAAPAFISALNDQDEGIRWYAASALKTVKPETERLHPT
jgi:HEAT repeat protein